MKLLVTLIRKIGDFGRQTGNIANYKANIKYLQIKVEHLLRMASDVKRLVEVAQRNGDSIKEAVQLWLRNVENIINEVMEMIGNAERINDGGFKGWCCARSHHHHHHHHHLDKEADKFTFMVDDILIEGMKFREPSNISNPSLRSSIQSMHTGHFQELGSRKFVVKQVIEALKDDNNIKVVGVYGMAGVGKTTLMKQVELLVQREHLFDEVLMATMFPFSDLRKIQGAIAERFGMKLEEESILARAERLWLRLTKARRVLIILDDLWESLDLADVGIPYGDSHRGCKVVITTRRQDVCYHMEAQPVIEVDVLSKQDSMNLFRQVVGDTMESHALHESAIEVVNECGGLPLAIVTIGKALRNKDQFVWEDAARQLRQSMFHDMRNVTSSIRLSCDYLAREEIKACFLFCCLFPRDFKFTKDELFLYVIGVELFRDVPTLEEARNRLHRMLGILVSSSLLLKEDEDGKVMMHQVVRGAGISMAHEESDEFIIKAGLGLRQWPDAENLRRCMHMSLIKNEISEFPHQPECTQLLTLSLSRNYSFERLPDSFFERMTSLVTLDLKRTAISLLPPSLSCLVNLQVLLLDHTSLSDVSPVGKLKKLEILSLSDNKIERLPEEIGALTNLKLLDLSKNYFLKTIPLNMFSSLSHLEELYMMGSFDGWEIDGMGDESKARLTELASLKWLTILEIDVSDAKCLSKEISINLRNLKQFRICGTGSGWKPNFLRAMSLNITSNPLSNWAKVLLTRTEELHLYSCKGLKNIVQLDRGRFNNLKFLRIEQCLEIRYLMTVMEEILEAAFSSLETLDIWSMSNLEAIYHGTLPNGFLEKLKLLSLRECQKIIIVLPSELLARMQNLEKLEIETCDELREVFDLEDLEEGHASIPRLKELYLRDLPKLTTVWKGMQKTIQLEEEEEDEIMVDKVHEITATSCTRLRWSKSYNVSSYFPSLPIFPNLEVLEISSCHSLNHLFPMNLVQGLMQLQVLKVNFCEEMEVIILGGEGEEYEEDKMVLPQLKTLELVYLPKLFNVHQRGLLFDWPSLEDLCVEECPNLRRLPLGLWSAPNLRKIEGDNAESFNWEDSSVKARLQPLFTQIPSP